MNGFADLFWQAYLVNLLFWAALAQGTVIFAAVLDITGARWGWRYVQISRSFASFLPVCVVLFLILLLGRNHVFPWIAHPVPEKAAYLNVPFLAARDLGGLAVMAALSWVALARMKSAHESGRSGASPWSVTLVLAFMTIYSYLAFDLIMSLEPHWYSTLLGAHYAVGSFYLGIAGLCFAGCMRPEVPGEDRRNLCRLMFGLALFWVSLLWSQYIVIWYGDIPEETRFVYLRFYQMPWTPVTLVVLALAFVLPFFMLMPRRAKLIGIVPALASLFVMAGLLLEKYVLVVPSLSPDALTLGWVQLLVTAAFAAIFLATYKLSVRRARPMELPLS